MGIELGETIGDYQIIGLLGRGGMGKVFKVRNVISDRIEAMKVLLPDADESPEMAERFIREIKVVASLEHPNIAALRTALRLRGQLVMIMEYVEGASLEEGLRCGNIGISRSAAYICQVLSALDYAHRAGVVHRDIKPSNILISAQGAVKLTDFGIASKLGDPRLTATGTAIGSLYYMSPEQVRTEAVDARTDLYSAGLVLYEAVTGRRPIQGDSAYSVMKAQLEVRPVPPIELLPDLPPELSRAIEKSLEKEPAARFQTAGEFRAALLESPGIAAALPGTLRTPSAFAPVSTFPAPGSAPHQLASQGLHTPYPGLTPLQCAASPSNSPQQYVPSEEKSVSSVSIHTPVPGGESGGLPAGFGQAIFLDPAQLERVRKDLAVYIGPMAKVIVNRAGRQARSIQELYDMVAKEIASAADRQKFLSCCPF